MYLVLPIANEGCSTMIVSTSAGVLTFTAYWSTGRSCWLCDLQDGAGADIATGIALLAGQQSLIKGLGNTALDGYALTVLAGADNGERDGEAWGASAVLVLSDPGAAPVVTISDPILVAPDWGAIQQGSS
jgi:hypothetical protein